MSTRRKLTTCSKSLPKFIIYCCIEYTSPWAGFKPTAFVVIANYHTMTTTTIPSYFGICFIFNVRINLQLTASVVIQPPISLNMPVPSQGHYDFHSFPVVDWFCLFINSWVLAFPLEDCSISVILLWPLFSILAANTADDEFETRSNQTNYFENIWYLLLLRSANNIREKAQRLVGSESG